MPQNPSKDIAKQVSDQEEEMLKAGRVPGDGKFGTLRQRHIWSTYHFVYGAGLAIQNSTLIANNQIVVPGTYRVFRESVGKNGQGLPAGLMLGDTDTNFLGEGRMPDQQNFAVWEVGVSILPQRVDVVSQSLQTRGAGPLHPDDVSKILDDGILRVKYITEEVSLGHFADFAQPGGPGFTVPSVLDYTGAAAYVAASNSVYGGQNAGNMSGQPFSAQIARAVQNSGNMAASPGTRRKLDVPIFLPARTQFEFQLVFKRPVLLRSLQNGGTVGFQARVDLWVAESYRAVS